MQIVSDWFKRYLSDPQVVILAILLIGGFTVILFFGNMLAPVIASLVIAYLLEGVVRQLQRVGVPRFAAVLVVFVAFLAFLLFVLFGLLPLLSRQVTQLIQQLPNMIAQGQELLMQLPQRYPNIVSEQQAVEVVDALRSELASWGQGILSYSIASVVGVITLLVYLVLMPLLVFFFLKDKVRLCSWFRSYMPDDLDLAARVWSDVDIQIGNYVRGKFFEIMIVWVVSYVTFTFMGLQFAILLGMVVGLSVIIPYIGATVVTLPVAVIAYFQWGYGADFGYLLLAYAVIQALDGNVLVPLLFSEVINLHPVAIIVAVLIFGGLWGFWGVFFAIPLATLVQAVLSAWPRDEHKQPEPAAAIPE